MYQPDQSLRIDGTYLPPDNCRRRKGRRCTNYISLYGSMVLTFHRLSQGRQTTYQPEQSLEETYRSNASTLIQSSIFIRFLHGNIQQKPTKRLRANILTQLIILKFTNYKTLSILHRSTFTQLIDLFQHYFTRHKTRHRHFTRHKTRQSAFCSA